MNILSSLMQVYARLFHSKMKVDAVTNEEYTKLESYYNNLFGGDSFVLHEIISSFVHIDILVFPPTKERNYFALATIGMSAKKMNVTFNLPRNVGNLLKYAELVIFLPGNWKIDKPNEKTNYSNDINSWWPIKLLKSTARLPFEENSWIGYGHSVSNDENFTPYASNTKLCAAVLLNPSFGNLKLDKVKLGKKEFFIHALVPIYKEELSYKTEHGAEKLDELLKQKNVSRVVDIDRTCVVK